MIKNILNVIGNTPLISTKNINEKDKAQILLKYERVNPGGSIKDRSANFIIEEAERRGLLKPGGTIIESSSGNFGISLAMIGAVKGYKVIILVDPKTTETNLALLKAYGAEVIVVTEKDDCGSYHKTRISLANKLAMENENSFRPDQCFSLLNGEAYYRSAVREIINECRDELSAIIVAVSTGGQIGGISRYIKNYYPEVKIIGVDAVGSVIFGGNAHSYKIPGIGLGWTPTNVDMDLIDEAYKIEDEIAFAAARIFAKQEGILMGPSGGACAVVGLHIANRLRGNEKVVCMIADGGDHYIDTLFNDNWMKNQGFSLNTDIEFIRKIAYKLKPLDTSSPNCRNYCSDLIRSLNVPSTTVKVNNDLKKEYTTCNSMQTTILA